MGWWGLVFFSDEVAQLKAFRDTLKSESQKIELTGIINRMEEKLKNAEPKD